MKNVIMVAQDYGLIVAPRLISYLEGSRGKEIIETKCYVVFIT